MTLISTQTASNSATLGFTGANFPASSYNTLLLDCNGIIPVTSSVTFYMQISQSSSFKSDAHYLYGGNNVVIDSGTTSVVNTTTDTGFKIAGAVGNSSSAPSLTLAAKIWIHNPSDTTSHKNIIYEVTFGDSNGHMNHYTSGGNYTNNNAAWDGIQLLFSSGNISSGQCSLYGLSK